MAHENANDAENLSQAATQEFGLAAVLLWVAATVYRFRRQIWNQPADLAAPGLVHYRMVMQRRRHHLLIAWILLGIFVRRNKAAELQREIEELER